MESFSTSDFFKNSSTTSLMKNLTVFAYDRTQKLDWILSVTITILLLILTLWILLSLIFYGNKTKKWSKNQGTTEVLNSGLIYSSVVSCAILCIFRFCVSLAFLNIGYELIQNNTSSYLLCDQVGDATNMAYSLLIGNVIMFLWFRQRAFYANQLLNVNYSKVIKFFSYFSLVLIFVYGLILIVFNTLPISYTPSFEGCVAHPSSTLKTKFWISVIVFVVLFYIILLGLLFYALTQANSATNKRKRHALNHNAVGHIHIVNENAEIKRSSCLQCLDFISKNRGAHNKKKIILQRTLFFAIISIACDVFLQLCITFVIDSNGHRRITTTLFNINSFINLSLVILSFSAYKQMVTFTLCGNSHSSKG